MVLEAVTPPKFETVPALAPAAYVEVKLELVIVIRTEAFVKNAAALALFTVLVTIIWSIVTVGVPLIVMAPVLPVAVFASSVRYSKSIVDELVIVISLIPVIIIPPKE